MLSFFLANRTSNSSYGQSAFDRFDRHRPPTNEGTADPVILEKWLREMEKLFAATNCPTAERVPISSYYLKTEADNWWSIIKWSRFAAKLKE